MEGFPVTASIEVRWRDVDAMGHVNNAVYFTYFEVARSRYYETVFQARELRDIDFILASIQCDYVSPVRHGEIVEVGIRVPSAGRTSFEFEYEARVAPGGRVVARARSTQVRYDYSADRKVEITESWLDKVAAAQGQRPSTRPRNTVPPPCRSRAS